MHLARNILKGKKMSKKELRKEAREEIKENDSTHTKALKKKMKDC